MNGWKTNGRNKTSGKRAMMGGSTTTICTGTGPDEVLSGYRTGDTISSNLTEIGSATLTTGSETTISYPCCCPSRCCAARGENPTARHADQVEEKKKKKVKNNPIPPWVRRPMRGRRK